MTAELCCAGCGHSRIRGEACPRCGNLVNPVEMTTAQAKKTARQYQVGEQYRLQQAGHREARIAEIGPEAYREEVAAELEPLFPSQARTYREA